MPRTHFTLEGDRLRDLSKLIDRYRRIEELTREELAKRLAMSPTTLADRFKRHPGKWTIAQLWTAAAVLHIPAEEINKALCAGTKRR